MCSRLQLDLRGNRLGPAGAAALALGLAAHSSLTTINLSNNVLCGVDDWGKGTYTAEGLTVIADALRVNGGLTSINLSGNNLTNYGIDMTGLKELVPALGVNGALTEVRWPSVFGPQIVTCSELTACALCIQVNLDGYALPIKKLKGTEPVESLDLSNKRLGVASAIVIASLIGVNGALTEVH
jgi:hypothetical protein